MSDETECTLTTHHSNEETDSLSCYIPRKKMKLTQTKSRNMWSLTDKTALNHENSNSWKFIDKNETMIAELSGGKLTLWQFLLELLMDDEYCNLIKWTDRNIGEFILIQAEEVAKLWGIRKDRNHRMNYDKLSRALRYYYQKNIIKKVHGHKFVYRFVSLVPEPITSSGSDLKTISSGHHDALIQPLVSESEIIVSNETSVQRSGANNMSNTLKSKAKNNKKNDFNSALTALFQAALLSLSDPNTEMSPSMLFNQKESEPRVCSPNSSHNSEIPLLGTRLFDVPPHNPTSIHQDCICKPEVLQKPNGMFSSSPNVSASSIHIPPFDRQSMLHFSRHSINMQRLSQEILLHATSKSRFSHGISNPLLSSSVDSINTSLDPTSNNFWLNQFSNNLYKSKSVINNSQESVDNSISISHEENDSPEVKVKSEKSVQSIPITENEDSTNLTTLFQKFVNEFNSKSSSSSHLVNGEQYQHYSNYSNTNLANLIKSQLSSNSSFIWMPVPVNFAEEIMDLCVHSSNNPSP